MIDQLEQLGFSRSEARVYTALLDVGPTTAGEIIKKSSLHRNIVYECLNKLKDRKLVSQTLKTGKKFFTPLDPEIILREEKKKLEIAENLAPLLVGKLKKDYQQVIIYEGLDEHRNLQYEQMKKMPKKGTYYVIGATGKFNESMGEMMREYEALRISKNVRLKIIYYKKQFEKEEEETKKRKYVESRVISENLETPAYTVIWSDSIVIGMFTDPIINIEIVNKDVVKAYLNYFNLLWTMGEQ